MADNADARTLDTKEWIECFLREGGDPYCGGGYDPDLQSFLRRRERDRIAERNQATPPEQRTEET